MTADDGGAMDPAIARVLLIYREAVAQATETACLDLRAVGVDDPEGLILGRSPGTWKFPTAKPRAMPRAARRAYAIANRVQQALEAATEPGGALHNDLSDFIARVSGVAMDAAGVPDVDDRGELWDWDPAKVTDLVRWEIAERFFAIARDNALEPQPAA